MGSGGQATAQNNDPIPSVGYATVVSTATVGALGGVALLAGVPALIAHELDDPGGSVSGAQIVFILTAPLGVWLGQAWGAAWGTEKSPRPVAMRELLMPAALWWTGAFTLTALTESRGAAVLGFSAAMLGTPWSAHSLSKTGSTGSGGEANLLPVFDSDGRVGLQIRLSLPPPY